MLEAVEAVYGVAWDAGADPIADVGPHGKTDRQIVREMLVPRGLDAAAIEAGFAEFERVAAERHSASRDELLDAGERERTATALDGLAAAGHTLALLTGNLEPIARHKMDLAGLGGYFARGQGAFGSDAEKRPELVPIARGRAAAPDGRPHPADDTVVIGDTPLDVAAAHAGGVRAIGVAGTRFTRADLLESGADAAVDELDEVERVLAAWS
ncbi:MAG: phosphoglycolate phosphatase [Thermoleophilaceae bacterium]|nr:phosphoglycolate phosphatase [Thermoleophilaceae bacterium]